MRSLRAERLSGVAPQHRQSDGRDLTLSGAGAALSAFYAARIAALRSSAAPRDRAALLRVLHDERRDAFRALAERRQGAALAARERRATERFGDKATRRQERPPSLPP